MCEAKLATTSATIFLRVAPYINGGIMDSLRAHSLPKPIMTPNNAFGGFQRPVGDTIKVYPIKDQWIAKLQRSGATDDVEFFITDRIIPDVRGTDYVHVTFQSTPNAYKHLYYSIGGRTQQWAVPDILKVGHVLVDLVVSIVRPSTSTTNKPTSCSCGAQLSSVEIDAGYGQCAGCICQTEEWGELAAMLLEEQTPQEEYISSVADKMVGSGNTDITLGGPDMNKDILGPQ